jgi:hypothetical protein
MTDSFLSSYLAYTAGGEVPVCFNRWAALSGIATILERNLFIPHGHSHIYPNQYLMLIGTAGTRKSTAVKLMKSMLIKAGFTSIAAERTSKEKFLVDLAGGDSSDYVGDILDKNLFGDDTNTAVSPMAIMADEANDFFGYNNVDFLSLLGSLWDLEGTYSSKTKTSGSISIPNPTISILSGNTPTGFAAAFPPEIIGQGFFSRILLIYGEPNGKRIPFPTIPDPHHTADIVNYLQRIKSYHYGGLGYTDTAKALLSLIYSSPKSIEDLRFDSYYNRRFTHLLKLCIIVAASKLEKEIGEQTVIEANTYLSYAESLMPKALGEFGKSRNSDVTHKILSFIEAHDGVSLKQIIKLVSSDLDKTSDIGDIIRKLSQAEKIQTHAGIFFPMRKKSITDTTGTIDLSYLTQEELAVKG